MLFKGSEGFRSRVDDARDVVSVLEILHCLEKGLEVIDLAHVALEGFIENTKRGLHACRSSMFINAALQIPGVTSYARQYTDPVRV